MVPWLWHLTPQFGDINSELGLQITLSSGCAPDSAAFSLSPPWSFLIPVRWLLRLSSAEATLTTPFTVLLFLFLPFCFLSISQLIVSFLLPTSAYQELLEVLPFPCISSTIRGFASFSGWMCSTFGFAEISIYLKQLSYCHLVIHVYIAWSLLGSVLCKEGNISYVW